MCKWDCVFELLVKGFSVQGFWVTLDVCADELDTSRKW